MGRENTWTVGGILFKWTMPRTRDLIHRALPAALEPGWKCRTRYSKGRGCQCPGKLLCKLFFSQKFSWPISGAPPLWKAPPPIRTLSSGVNGEMWPRFFYRFFWLFPLVKRTPPLMAPHIWPFWPILGRWTGWGVSMTGKNTAKPRAREKSLKFLVFVFRGKPEQHLALK